MAEKKETVKKTVPKTVKKVTPAKNIKVNKKVEQQYFAKDLADRMGVSSFDYLLIKRQNNIQDDTPVTASEMQKMYNKIIRR